MTKKQTWVYSPKKEYNKVSENAKREIEKICDDCIEHQLRPTYLKSPQREKRELLNIYSKWHRNFIYFIAVIKDDDPNAISSQYEDKFARLEYRNKDRFLLAYFRHTGEWFELTYGQGMTLKDCLEQIEDMLHFDIIY